LPWLNAKLLLPKGASPMTNLTCWHIFTSLWETRWEPRRLTTLWASTASYRDSFTLPLPFTFTMDITWLCYKRLGYLFCVPKRIIFLLLNGSELNWIQSYKQATTTKFSAPTTPYPCHGVRLSPVVRVFRPQEGPIVPAPDSKCLGEGERGRVWSNGGKIIGKGKANYSEKTLFQCHFVHQKSYFNCPGIEPDPPGWEGGDWPL
jgi:hypothetical protein